MTRLFNLPKGFARKYKRLRRGGISRNDTRGRIVAMNTEWHRIFGGQ